MPDTPTKTERPIVVLKYGSGSVSDDNGIDSERLDIYASKIEQLLSSYRIVVVSSGSIAAGRAFMQDGEAADRLAAMVGSGLLVSAWQDALLKHGVHAGQVLVTHHEIADNSEHNQLARSIDEALRANIIPIINENDVLSDVELATFAYGGDNDGLAARLATTLEAQTLLLLTNVDSVLDETGARLAVIDASRVDDYAQLIGAKSSTGRGGMMSKINAAVQAHQGGVHAHIGSSRADYARLIEGSLGTQVE